MKSLQKSLIILVTLLLLPASLRSQVATVSEEMVTMLTYPFSDPDPVPAPGRIYPWFYFSGYTAVGTQQEWKMVVLENQYIKVFVSPEIGGKVWGAVEKSTGHEFLYHNDVVKFRDIAMRGAWTSGGLEYNFGDIGHIPTCATPVDYITREYPDGSVSCVVGAIDLPTGSRWNVEILLRPDRAYFETIARWYNTSDLPVTYYHWMNAAAAARDDLQFIYPGNMHIGHADERGEWPVAGDRDLSLYRNNNFGSYKSYHVINSNTGFFGGYWNELDFGFGHWSRYDEKPGKKLWIWGLSEQGMIWEDLLTDGKGQYIEFQAGKLFNQAAEGSSVTPFKHREFAPYDSDIMHEIWFPLVGTGGMKAVSPLGIINLEGGDVIISALAPIDEILLVEYEGRIVVEREIKLSPTGKLRIENAIPGLGSLTVSVGGDKLRLDSQSRIVDRPVVAPSGSTSVYSLYVEALELEKQRLYPEAEEKYRQVLVADPLFVPALNRMASSYLRRMNADSAMVMVNRSLVIDTYNGEGNYLLGLTALALGDTVLAESGLSIAMADPAWRSAAALVLSRSKLSRCNYNDAIHYSSRALEFNSSNIEALMVMAVAAREINDIALAMQALDRLSRLDPLLHFTLFERYLLTGDEKVRDQFKGALRSELPWETAIDLAVTYYSMGCRSEAMDVLELSPAYPVVTLWMAFLDAERRGELLTEALEADPLFVFPHRTETAGILSMMADERPHWKLDYYLALIHWNRGNKDFALSLLNGCGSSPGFAPFYIARSRLRAEEGAAGVEEDLRRAVELSPSDWRAGLELARYSISQGELSKALFLERYLEANPEQPAIGVTWANILLLSERYADCVGFLGDYNVLPYEGATAARDIYHAAAMMEAVKLTSQREYDEALAMVRKAASWPLNLGSGRPYEVDERDIMFLEALILYGSGKRRDGDSRMKRVAGFEPGPGLTPSLLLQLLAADRLGDSARKESLLSMLRNREGDPESSWIMEMYNAGSGADQGIDKPGDMAGGITVRTRAGVSEYDIVSALAGLAR